MGKILYLKCNKNKEHDKNFFIGTGNLLGLEYNKLIKQIKKGKYGEELKNFIRKYPYPKGIINCNLEIAQCPKCRKMENVTNLSMYILKENYNLNEIIAKFLKKYDIKQLNFINKTLYYFHSMKSLRVYYKKFKEYKHICYECSKTMKIIKIKYDKYGRIMKDVNNNVIKNIELKCPKCDSLMEINSNNDFWF